MEDLYYFNVDCIYVVTIVTSSIIAQQISLSLKQTKNYFYQLNYFDHDKYNFKYFNKFPNIKYLSRTYSLVISKNRNLIVSNLINLNKLDVWKCDVDVSKCYNLISLV